MPRFLINGLSSVIFSQLERTRLWGEGKGRAEEEGRVLAYAEEEEAKGQLQHGVTEEQQGSSEDGTAVVVD